MPQIMRTLITLALFGTAWAADVTFASGHNCTGQALYGGKSLQDVTCYNLLTNTDSATSVVLANLEPDQKFTAFSDGFCQDMTYSTSHDSCYTEPGGRIGSFQIESNSAAAASAVSTKDLVPYGVKLSNYKDLAVMDPYAVDIKYGNFFMGLALTASAGALTIFGAISGCATIKGPDPVAIIACVGAPLATIFSFAASYYFSRSGANVNNAIAMVTGNFRNNGKRSLIDDINYDYMSGALNQTSQAAIAHVGFTKRDMGYGEQSSPIYEVEIGDSGKWHMAAFLDEDSGDFIHHLRPAEDLELLKRSSSYPYDAIRWKSGGFDFHFCYYNQNSPKDGFSLDTESMYQTAYDQLTCLATVDQFKAATKVGIDMYTENSVIVGELEIIPYAGTTERAAPLCSKTSFPINQDCIVA